MTRYAQGTTVSTEKSVAEIERLIERFGASEFMQIKRNGQYQCWWQIKGTTFTAQLNYTDAPDEREIRRRWRVIVQHIKSQLIAVDEGLLQPRAALLPFLMLADGGMAADRLEQQIEQGNGPDLPMLMAPVKTT